MNNDITKSIAVFFCAVLAGVLGYMALDAALPTDVVPTVEEVDTDNLTAGRYHQRTRTNDFFRRGGG